jgi:hypothetical protein
VGEENVMRHGKTESPGFYSRLAEQATEFMRCAMNRPSFSPKAKQDGEKKGKAATVERFRS